MKDGICEDCGQWWSERAGGIDEHGQSQRCRKKFPCDVTRDLTAIFGLEKELGASGAGLGV